MLDAVTVTAPGDGCGCLLLKEAKTLGEKAQRKGNILVDLRHAVQMIIVIVASVPADT